MTKTQFSYKLESNLTGSVLAALVHVQWDFTCFEINPLKSMTLNPIMNTYFHQMGVLELGLYRVYSLVVLW